MTVRETICVLLDYPLDAVVYVGKGMGPLDRIESSVADEIYVVMSP